MVENIEIEIPVINKKTGKKAKAYCFSCEAIFEFYDEQGQLTPTGLGHADILFEGKMPDEAKL